MKRAKLRQLVVDVLDAREAMPKRPVTLDTLTVDFVNRTVTIRGRTIEVEQDAVSIPLLSTDRLVMSRDGRVL